MDDLKTDLELLEDAQLDYVVARSKVRTDAQGFRDAGIPKSTFYKWPEETRNYLNELAQRVKRESALRAIMILQDAAEDAANVKVQGLESRKEHIKQAAATEILDRNLGKPTQKQEITGKDGAPIISVNWDDEAEI